MYMQWCCGPGEEARLCGSKTNGHHFEDGGGGGGGGGGSGMIFALTSNA